MKSFYALLLSLFIVSCSTLTDEEKLLERVNTAVNRQISFVDNYYQYGQKDKWVTTCPAKGDCEDYALCKARKLVEAGVDPATIEIRVGETWRGVPHAVTVVGNRYLLDNLHSSVVSADSQALYKQYYSCTLDGRRIVWILDNTGRGLIPIETNNLDSLSKCKEAIKELMYDH